MKLEKQVKALALATALVLGAATQHARADTIIEWNTRAGDVIAEAKLGTPPAVRVMAFVQTAVHDAMLDVGPRASASAIDAAVAAATRGTLGKLVPSQQAAIDALYRTAVDKIADGGDKSAGIAAGEKAAASVMARADGVAAPETYRPAASPGAYVPTASPAVPQWPARKPWSLASASQFRPAPPPALTSEAWTRDFNEVKALGSRNSTRRNAEQTEIARFWEFSLPSIYFGAVRSVAQLPGRDAMRNARLYAAVAQAMDDGLISVFDAKYHYNFWRPVTAIRNGDLDGNEATERDAGWTSAIDSPMHPEYPSAHSVLASAVGHVLKADVGKGAMPALTTASPTAKGATRRWVSIDEFTREVADSRVYAGIHYRTSVEVGVAMGAQVGAATVAKFESMD